MTNHQESGNKDSEAISNGVVQDNENDNDSDDEKDDNEDVVEAGIDAGMVMKYHSRYDHSLKQIDSKEEKEET